MSQNLKTAAAPLAAHNAWRRNWRQKHVGRQTGSISDALTVTSVNPLVLRGNACSLKINHRSWQQDAKLQRPVPKLSSQAEPLPPYQTAYISTNSSENPAECVQSSSQYCGLRPQNQILCVPPGKTSNQTFIKPSNSKPVLPRPSDSLKDKCAVPLSQTDPKNLHQAFPRPSTQAVPGPTYQVFPGSSNQAEPRSYQGLYPSPGPPTQAAASPVSPVSVIPCPSKSVKSWGRTQTSRVPLRLGCAGVKVMSLRQGIPPKPKPGKVTEEWAAGLEGANTAMKRQTSVLNPDALNLKHATGTIVVEKCPSNVLVPTSDVKPTSEGNSIEGNTGLHLNFKGQECQSAVATNYVKVNRKICSGTESPNAVCKNIHPINAANSKFQPEYSQNSDSTPVLKFVEPKRHWVNPVSSVHLQNLHSQCDKRDSEEISFQSSGVMKTCPANLSGTENIPAKVLGTKSAPADPTHTKCIPDNHTGSRSILLSPMFNTKCIPLSSANSVNTRNDPANALDARNDLVNAENSMDNPEVRNADYPSNYSGMNCKNIPADHMNMTVETRRGATKSLTNQRDATNLWSVKTSSDTTNVNIKSDSTNSAKNESDPVHLLNNKNDPALPVDNESDPANPVNKKSDSANPVNKRSDPANLGNNKNDLSHLVDNKSDPSHPVNNKSDPAHHVNNKSDPSNLMNNKSDPSHTVNTKSDPAHSVNKKSDSSHLVNKSDPPRLANSKSDPARPVNNKSDPPKLANSKSDPARPVNNRSDPPKLANSKSDPTHPVDNKSDPANPLKNKSDQSNAVNRIDDGAHPVSSKSGPENHENKSSYPVNPVNDRNDPTNFVSVNDRSCLANHMNTRSDPVNNVNTKSDPTNPESDPANPIRMSDPADPVNVNTSSETSNHAVVNIRCDPANPVSGNTKNDSANCVSMSTRGDSLFNQLGVNRRRDSLSHLCCNTKGDPTNQVSMNIRSDLANRVSTRSDPAHPVNTIYDPTNTLYTRGDPENPVNTDRDFAKDVNTRSDPVKQVNTRSDPADDVNVSSDLTKFVCDHVNLGCDHLSHLSVNTKSGPSNHVSMNTMSDSVNDFVNTRSDSANHTNTRSDPASPINIRDGLANPVNTRNTTNCVNTRNNQESRVNTGGDPASLVKTRNEPAKSANTRSDSANHLNTRSGQASPADTGNALKNAMSTRNDSVNHVNTTNDPAIHVSTRNDVTNHVNTRSSPANPLSIRSDPASAVNTSCGPANAMSVCVNTRSDLLSHMNMNAKSAPTNHASMNTMSESASPANTRNDSTNLMTIRSDPASPVNIRRDPVNSTNTVNHVNIWSGTAKPVNTGSSPVSHVAVHSTCDTANSVNTVTVPANPVNTVTVPANPMNTVTVPANSVNTVTVQANPVNARNDPIYPVIVDARSDPANRVNTLSDPATNKNTRSDPKNPVNTMNDPANSKNTRSDPENPVNTMAEPASSKNTRSDPASPVNTMTEPANNENTRSDPENYVNTMTEPANTRNTSCDPENPVNTMTEPPKTKSTRYDPANRVNTGSGPADTVPVDTRNGKENLVNNISADSSVTGNDPASHLDTEIIPVSLENTNGISADSGETENISAMCKSASGNTGTPGGISENLVDTNISPWDGEEQLCATCPLTENSTADPSGDASNKASLENTAPRRGEQQTPIIPTDVHLERGTPESTGKIDNAPAIPAVTHEHSESETKTGTEFQKGRESDRRPSSLPGNANGVSASARPRPSLPKLARGSLPNSDGVSCSRNVNQKSQYQLTAKRAEAIYSQKLRRSSGRVKAGVSVHRKEKADCSAQNAAPSWSRVRSAQPHVYRAVVRAASRSSQRRCKSVLDMAVSEEPGSRCQSRLEQTPGLHDARSPYPAPTACSEELLDKRQVEWLMSLWGQCVANNNLDKMLHVLKRLPFAQRRQLTEVTSTSSPMLITCCQLGCTQMVDYLLDECGADVEKEGEFSVVDRLNYTARYQASPLWSAAVAGHVDVVKTLIHHGANIDYKTSSGSTSMRSACFMSNVEVVKTLMEAGADIHAASHSGGTCLINSVHCLELLRLLLRHGARPNEQDDAGNTPLHYAAKEGRLESVRLLVQFGGDCRRRNRSGNTVLEFGALNGWPHIVEYIINNTHAFKFKEVIEAYELLGCGLVDERDEYDLGMDQWRKALMLRLKVFPKTNLRQERIAAFHERLEFTSRAELDSMAADPDEIRMQSLLIRERICGRLNREVSVAMIRRGDYYYHALMYRPCMELWKYTFRVRLATLHPLSRELEYTSYKIVKLFLELCEHHVKDDTGREVLRVSDTLDILKLLVEQLDRAKPSLQQYLARDHPDGCDCLVCDTDGTLYPRFVSCGCDHHTKGAEETYFLTLMFTLYLVRMIATHQQLCPDNLQRFRSLVYQLVKGDHRSQTGDSLLHLCFPLCELEVTKDDRIPTIPLLKTLIACGADADAVNMFGETPLFYILSPKSEAKQVLANNPDRESWVVFLLEHDAHIDRVAHKRRGMLSFLKALDSVCPLNHMNLQCLAARAIRDHEVPYKDPWKLSPDLIDFVSYH